MEAKPIYRSRKGLTGVNDERPLRYFLPGQAIGLPSARLLLHTLAGVALWLLPALLLARLLGRQGAHTLLQPLQRWLAARMLRHLGVRLELDGLQQIDPSQTYVVVALHEGLADGLAMLQLPLRMRFVVRDELLGWRLIGPYLRDTGQIAVCPEHGARSYRRLRQAADTISAQGESIVIFPQGSILGIETQFLRGAFALAQALELPVLPVVLTGSHRVWEYPYTPRLRYGQRMSLRVLPPVPAREVKARSVEELRDSIQASLKDAALSGALAAPRRFVPARDGYWDGYAYEIDPRFPALAADIQRRRQEHAAACAMPHSAPTAALAQA